MIKLTEIMVLNGFICPVCGKFFKPNGVGPESAPKLTKLLNKLPSSHVLRYGAYWHDSAYHLGKNWGSREDADLLMYEKNEWNFLSKREKQGARDSFHERDKKYEGKA